MLIQVGLQKSLQFESNDFGKEKLTQEPEPEPESHVGITEGDLIEGCGKDFPRDTAHHHGFNFMRDVTDFTDQRLKPTPEITEEEKARRLKRNRDDGQGGGWRTT